MAIIMDILDGIDSTIGTLVASTYTPILNSVLPVVSVATVLMVILVGVNLATQTVSLTLANSLSVGFRIVLVYLFLQFGNISVVYEALTNGPAAIGANMLSAMSDGSLTDPTAADTNPSLYSGLDAVYVRALDVGQALAQNGGYLAGAITSAFMFLIAAFMATVTIIVLAAAKIMLAVLLAIAPLMIALTLFKQSAPIFESWVKLAIGFSFIPLLVAAMAGFTIATADGVTPPDLASVETLGDAISFIVVMMLGAGLIVQVPSFANSFASTNTGIGAVASYASGAYQRNATRAGRVTGKGASVAGRGAGGAAYGAATGKQLGAGSSKAAQRGSKGGAALHNRAKAVHEKHFSKKTAEAAASHSQTSGTTASASPTRSPRTRT